MPKRERDLLAGAEFDWPRERAACGLYLRKLTLPGQRTDALPSAVDAAAACLFEYSREIDLF